MWWFVWCKRTEWLVSERPHSRNRVDEIKLRESQNQDLV